MNLQDADLQDVNLRGADLQGADLQDVKNAELILARTEIQPREGEVIGWKQCREKVIVKLRVPPDAKRSNALGRKCRASAVEVLEIYGGEIGLSLHDGVTEYSAGSIVVANDWTADRFVECGHGIHYYLTREEADAHT